MGKLTQTKLSSNLTTIPSAVRNYLEVSSGDHVEWHLEDGTVVVRKQDLERED